MFTQQGSIDIHLEMGGQLIACFEEITKGKIAERWQQRYYKRTTPCVVKSTRNTNTYTAYLPIIGMSISQYGIKRAHIWLKGGYCRTPPQRFGITAVLYLPARINKSNSCLTTPNLNPYR